jgi:THO complex subunit 3
MSSSKRERDPADAGPSRVPSPKRRNVASSPMPVAADDDVDMEGEGDTTGVEVEPAEDLGSAGETVVSRSDAAATASIPPPAASQISSPSSRSLRSLPSLTNILAPTTSGPQQLRRIKHSIVHSAALLALGLDPTGKFMAVGGQDALLSVFSTKDWTCTRTYDMST